MEFSQAGFFQRLFAFLFDKAITSGLTLVLLYGFSVKGIIRISPYSVVIILNLVDAIYFTYFHSMGGQTIGKWLMGIRVVNKSGSCLSVSKSALRWCGYKLSAVFIYIGFLWMLLDKNRQTWHDKLATSYVIR